MSNLSSRLGFMQGRLSPIDNNKIQEFPKKYWKKEFKQASKLGFGIMEWTLDYEDIYSNPLMYKRGREEIIRLKDKYGISIPSVTGDCFMQNPFWKSNNYNERVKLQKLLVDVVVSCIELEINYLLIPLVDNGSLNHSSQKKVLIEFLERIKDILKQGDLKIIFESDLSPKLLNSFISDFDPDTFGINYDIGNSASLDYDPEEEIDTYGERILNVHIKDRVRFGSTVPLGKGNAKFKDVFNALSKHKYSGNFILQTARSSEGEHARVLEEYRQFSINYIEEAFK